MSEDHIFPESSNRVGRQAYEKVRLSESSERIASCKVMLHTIHTGNLFPQAVWQALLAQHAREKQDPEAVCNSDMYERYSEERDWGADLMAETLARKLGLSHYWRFSVARSVLDFGRFPGVDYSSSAHLSRLAIPKQIAELEGVSDDIIESLLDSEYDGAASGIERAIQETVTGAADPSRRNPQPEWIGEKPFMKIALHTYDVKNPSGTRRPEVSLVFTPQSYHLSSKLSEGAFDPLFPNELADFTADRALVYRIAHTLERSYIPITLNQPYPLPEGSVEFRAQVWFFFHYLRKRYEAEEEEEANEFKEEAGYEERDAPKDVYSLVWRCLTNANSRNLETLSLRAYLDRYSRLEDRGSEIGRFQLARRIYAGIRRFLRKPAVVAEYRYNPLRPSSLAIEVRKDLLVKRMPEVDPENPQEPEYDLGAAEKIGGCLADAVETYLETDLPRKLEIWEERRRGVPD